MTTTRPIASQQCKEATEKALHSAIEAGKKSLNREIRVQCRFYLDRYYVVPTRLRQQSKFKWFLHIALLGFSYLRKRPTKRQLFEFIHQKEKSSFLNDWAYDFAAWIARGYHITDEIKDLQQLLSLCRFESEKHIDYIDISIQMHSLIKKYL